MINGVRYNYESEINTSITSDSSDTSLTSNESVSNNNDNNNNTKITSNSDKYDINGAEMWKIENFQIGKQIGCGNFSRVYLAREKASKKIVALKVLNKEQLNRTLQKSHFQKATWKELLRREIEIQHHFKHENITRLYGYFYDEQRVYLIMEYCRGGTLHALLKKYKIFHEYIVAKWIYQLLNALIYCHKRNVIHRDLKLENILYTYSSKSFKSLYDINIKIADFGFSTVLNGDRRYTFCGTLDYLAPEAIMSETKGYDISVDVWSLGVIVYELLTGKSPFYATNAFKTFQKIQKLDYTIPDYVSFEAKDLIQSLLKLDPEKRLKLSIATNHPFFEKYLQNYQYAF